MRDAMSRREFLQGAVAAGAGAAGLCGGRLLRAEQARQAGGADEGGQAGKRPNILFLFPDQHRYDWTSMNPALPDITPNLKVLTQRGVNFTRAFSPSPVCAPARACLASGREYARCRVASNGQTYPLDQTTFYTLLKQAGYRVLGCGKFDLDKPGHSWGHDGQHRRPGQPSLLEAWGFTAGIDNEGKMDGLSNYKTHPDRPGPYFRFLEEKHLVDAYHKNVKLIDHDYAGSPVLPDDAYGDNWIAANAIKLIHSVPAGEPWFIQINFNGPHPPMDVTKPMYEKWKEMDFPGPATGKGAKKAGKDGARRNYGAMIFNIDAWLGRLQEELAKRGELDRTLIVYCSDHGEMLGDRGMSGKSKPFQPSVGVPLVIAGPGVQRGVTCGQPVETLDLTATFLDFACIARPKDVDSLSLRAYIEGKGELPRSHVTSALGNWRLACEGKYKLIAGEGGDGLLLCDLEQDPHEKTDLSAKCPDVVARLKPLLPPATGGKEKKRSEDDKRRS